MGRSREQQREYMRAYRARKRAEAKAAEPEKPTPSATPAEPPAPRSTRHADAVARMLDETGLRRLDEESPLIELLKDLASELDAEPTARTRQQYLTALRDAHRVLAAAPGAAGASGASADEPETPAPVVEEPTALEADPEVADFESFRRAKGGTAGGG